MGKVVTLDPPAWEGPRETRRRRHKRSKTALVLGGGGFTGGVYEIGALRALDLLMVDRTANDFDVYVGTSVGAFVAALTANGVSPEEMMRAVGRRQPTPFAEVELGTLLSPNLAGFAKSALTLPLRAAQLLAEMLSRPDHTSSMSFVQWLAGGSPSGAYTGAGLERYLRDVLSNPDRSDDFRTLSAELYLTATDLDTCERVIFGVDAWDDVPISTAVRASTALPMVYTPVKVRDRELIDGGVVSTTNLDIAVDAGATFVVVVNPLVPFVNDFKTKVRTLTGVRPRHVSDMGLAQVGFQAFKIVCYQRLHEMACGWEERYPGVDIVLIEPEPNDELMFQTPLMSYASRLEIARHGFQSVTTQLDSGYPRFAEICKRHDIEISAPRVREVMEHFDGEEGTTRAWRKIFEQTTGALLRQVHERDGARDD